MTHITASSCGRHWALHVAAPRTGREHSVGAAYTTLQRLEDKGLLTSRASEPLPVRGGRSRRHFTLTGLGAQALRDAERHAASIWAGVVSPIRPELAVMASPKPAPRTTAAARVEPRFQSGIRAPRSRCPGGGACRLVESSAILWGVAR